LSGGQIDLSEKPRHGVESRNPAPHPGIDERNSTLAIGFRASLVLNGVGQSERARYYASNDARFMSPDWSAKVEPVPYAKLGDPQSLNLYGYMLDSPLDGVDQDGHQTGVLTWGEIWTTAEDGTIAGGPEVGLGILAGEISVETGNPAYSSYYQGQFQNPDGSTIFMKDPGKSSTPSKSGEPPQLKAGKEAHKNEEVRPGEQAEVPTASGKGRMDRYDAKKGHIREIKPDNARGRSQGQRQLERYKAEQERATGRPHTTELNLYKPKKQP
jgi:RHS repeat-associated protein